MDTVTTIPAATPTPERVSLLKKAPETLTRGERIAIDIYGLLRARNSVVWITTSEEARVERYVAMMAAEAGFVPHTWDCAQGTCAMSGPRENIGQPDGTEQSPVTTMQAILDRASGFNASRDVWIMRDLAPWIAAGQNPACLRMLRNAYRKLPTVGRETAQAIVIISPSADIPADLAGMPVVTFPLPDRDEISAIIDETIDGLSPAFRARVGEDMSNGRRTATIDAAVGLSGDQVATCFARSLVKTKTIDPVAVNLAKKAAIGAERLISFIEPLSGGLDSVGGLDGLKTWLNSRMLAFSSKARAYGLPMPKGVLLLGMSGCGKTLMAKACASAFGSVPLVKLDLNSMKGKFVGESEANIRKVLQTIESIGRCVVLLDEVEKALAGASSGASDGGVSSDALGTLLSWLQDNQSGAFVVATANDVSALPPELLRKGRFDEIFAVSLPTPGERAEILKTALRANKRGDVDVDVQNIASACEQFTGSEIASLVPEALFIAFADGEREIETRDLHKARQAITPLARTMAEPMKRLADWIKDGKARPASTPAVDVATSQARQIEL